MPNTNVVCHYSFQPYSAPVLKIISGIELIDIRVFRNPSNALSTNGKYRENRNKQSRLQFWHRTAYSGSMRHFRVLPRWFNEVRYWVCYLQFDSSEHHTPTTLLDCMNTISEVIGQFKWTVFLLIHVRNVVTSSFNKFKPFSSLLSSIPRAVLLNKVWAASTSFILLFEHSTWFLISLFPALTPSTLLNVVQFLHWIHRISVKFLP